VTKDRRASVDAITLLQQDHDRVAAAFREFEGMDRQDLAACRKLIAAVCEELKTHAVLEEELFYPAVRAAGNISSCSSRMWWRTYSPSTVNVAK
jgi:hypothetical protein